MTNEPTTGEIVRALRYCADEDTMCGLGCPAYLSEAGCRTAVMKNAADRLESQERTIMERDAYIELLKNRAESLENDAINYDMNLSEMTARAESAERERDALINSIERLRTKKIELCSICEFEDIIACCHKDHCDGCQLFKRRGQPQEGDGKNV